MELACVVRDCADRRDVIAQHNLLLLERLEEILQQHVRKQFDGSHLSDEIFNAPRASNAGLQRREQQQIEHKNAKLHQRLANVFTSKGIYSNKLLVHTCTAAASRCTGDARALRGDDAAARRTDALAWYTASKTPASMNATPATSATTTPTTFQAQCWATDSRGAHAVHRGAYRRASDLPLRPTTQG